MHVDAFFARVTLSAMYVAVLLLSHFVSSGCPCAAVVLILHNTQHLMEGEVVDRLTAQKGPLPPNAFCSRIMPLGTNDTWTKYSKFKAARF